MKIKQFRGMPATVAWTFAVALMVGTAPAVSVAGDVFEQAPALIKNRNIDADRHAAAEAPRSEADQAIVDGWPLYRGERSQEAFNTAMATLKATDGRAPAAATFRDCPQLVCNLKLPEIGADGWIPAGRIWVSPAEYMVVVHSPRLPNGESYNRRAYKSMRIFVFHEFQNSNYNIDLYDTLASHKRSVFVPLYLSKQATDARGHRFVTLVQVAPYDVVSRHATNWGSAGPGIEVAKNTADELQPLQATAGILVATMIKTAAPHLRVVNHRNVEGRPMLDAYDRRLVLLRGRPSAATLALPFVPAVPEKIAVATGNISDLIVRGDASPPLAVAARAFVPPALAGAAGLPSPTLIGPIRLAIRLHRLEPKLVGPIRLVTRIGAPQANSAAK